MNLLLPLTSFARICLFEAPSYHHVQLGFEFVLLAFSSIDRTG